MNRNLELFKRLVFYWIIIFHMLFASDAEAANWHLVAVSDEGTIYVDQESIVGSKDGPKEAWIKQIYTTPICDFEKYGDGKCMVSLGTYERSFRNKTSCSLQLVAYLSDGTTKSGEGQCNPSRIIPDTIGEKIWRFLFKHDQSNIMR